jgi:hypothetical protein
MAHFGDRQINLGIGLLENFHTCAYCTKRPPRVLASRGRPPQPLALASGIAEPGRPRCGWRTDRTPTPRPCGTCSDGTARQTRAAEQMAEDEPA